MKVDFDRPMKRILCVIAACSLLVFSVHPAAAQEIMEVISTSPSWDTFTNRDGTGLYHEVLREVFGQYGIAVRHEYSKSSRSEKLVEQGIADMMTCDDKASEPLVQGRYPMYENSYHVFYRKGRIGEWKGVESLRDKEVLSQPTYYNQSNFTVPVAIKEVQTGSQALSMIVLDRSDFYVDDMTLIMQSIKESEIDFNEADFAISEVGRRSYHPLFSPNKRGERIRKLYEEGIWNLHKSGKLRSIYDKWGYLYPEFERY